jgi:hypothetical protein
LATYAVRRFVQLMLFLLLVNEGAMTFTIYAPHMFSPFTWVDAVLFDPLPIKVRPFDLILIIMLIATGLRGPKVIPMRTTMFVAMATTVLFYVLGIARGGDARAASWQVYLMLATPLAALSIAATHTKAIHYRSLAKAVVAAAIYRAIMCWIFYWGYARSLESFPPLMTSHSDTVLWIIAVGMLMVNFLEQKSSSAKLMAGLGIPLILGAVQFNNRRLAWVSLAMSVAALYFLLPPSAPKRRLKRLGLWLLPVVGSYVAVGWGRPEKIFKPLASLSSVSSKPDGSTLARNVENLSLIATASYGPLTGSGWGHKYIELSNKYTIAGAMELWPYIPHNSILGLFAYTGILGVMGYWLMFPTGVFLHARCARMAKDPLMRAAGTVGVMMSLTCVNQMFGDMGIFSWTTMYLMSVVWAAALRIPIEAGVWGPGAARTNGTREPAPPVVASAPPPQPPQPSFE